MSEDCQHTFGILTGKLSQLTLSRTKGDRSNINGILDEINLLDFKKPLVSNASKAVLLIHQCCTLILPDDHMLITKCCKLIQNLINFQNIVIEGQTFVITIRWILQALRNTSDPLHFELLITLDTILRTSKKNLTIVLPEIIVNNGTLLQILENKNIEIVLNALQILEVCTSSEDEGKAKKNEKYECVKEHMICANIFEKFLTNINPHSCDDIIFCKVLICCLNGLQNIIQQNSKYLLQKLGLLLGICKSYMVYCLNNVNFVIPQIITPSNFALAEPFQSVSRDKKGGKVTKQRKHRATKGKKDTNTLDLESELNVKECQNTNTYVPVSNFTTQDMNVESTLSLVKMKASDSDFSDTEGGKAAKVRITQGRVRQAALSLLFHVITLTEKSKIFPFWSSFMPGTSVTSKHNLKTCILHEPSSRSRMAALNVLLAFLNSSKMYLSQAETSNKYSAFTPFSTMLGETIEELHKCLCLALNENSVPVLMQCLKCVSALIQSTPYHRLKPGLLSKVIRNVKVFIKHKDATVQVGALIVLGCSLASEPVVPETKQALLRQTFKYFVKEQKDKNRNPELFYCSENEFECAIFSSDDETEEREEDSESDGCDRHISWLLQTCLDNLSVETNNQVVVPTPVKLESLQIISAMTRNYFDSLMTPHLSLITDALVSSFRNENHGVHLHLHAGRTVDFIGQRMSLYFSNKDGDKSLSLEKGLEFWTTLLNGPLLDLVQDENNPTLRAVGCDCLGSIGPHIFQYLQRDKQILIVTLLFGGSRDSESMVKAAAIRSLGICVQYPTLKEDIGFVIDVADTIHNTLQDPNTAVKIKSAWSLGNLSDTLAASKPEDGGEEIPTSLLVKMLKVTIAFSGSNDKIKMNTVRALGNLLQLIRKHILNDECIKLCVEEAFNVLISCSTTGTHAKVRWNACYALGNALKNNDLYFEGSKWQGSVFSSLSSLVINHRNFKVRINAGYALCCPVNRECYGSHFDLVWESLLKALENAENMEDFSEYKHRNNLVEQICLTIAHLTTLLTAEDLKNLQHNLNFYSDLLTDQMHRVNERLIPEKSAILMTASEHLKYFLKNIRDLTPDQKDTMDYLTKIFCITIR